MGSQSTAKTLFLLVSMVGWLAIGGGLIYGCPWLYHLMVHSERTTLWMQNLQAGGYHPEPGLMAGAILLPLEMVGNWWWSTQVEPHQTPNRQPNLPEVEDGNRASKESI
ncbi:hypothetical protein [Lyngbya confervoides]|uniref:Uncharacterized protein n=1 Tax=Lyngbya confervoides BDU141951 TaxID=1574623 RepID=A0ABD4T5Z9_9CYAN|nr:hypothetical protein [Lyngbya confervoides]MCM1983992.1 hypothetical protein [Lyngbya confervoides BDU141951]